MISPVGSSDNKRHTALAIAGGVVLGGQEVYKTRSQLLGQKELFTNCLKDLFYNKANNAALENYFNKQIQSVNDITILKTQEQQSVNNFYKKVNELQKKTKNEIKNNIKEIKQAAKYKIPIKITGGVLIGAGISLLVSQFKKKSA